MINSLNNFEKLNITDSKNIFPGYWGHSTTLYNNKLYIFGGFNDNDKLLYSNKLITLDINTLKYKAIIPSFSSEIPDSRANHIAGLYKNRHTNISGLFIFGGTKFDTVYNDMYVYYFETNEWDLYDDSSPVIGGYCSGEIIKDYLIVVGGNSNNDAETNNNKHNKQEALEVFVFDIINRLWFEVSFESLKPRNFHSSCFLGDSLLIFFGIHKSYESCYSDYLEIDFTRAFKENTFNQTKLYSINSFSFTSQLDDNNEYLINEIESINDYNNESEQYAFNPQSKFYYDYDETINHSINKEVINKLIKDSDSNNPKTLFSDDKSNNLSKIKSREYLLQSRKTIANYNKNINNLVFFNNNTYKNLENVISPEFKDYPLPRWASSCIKLTDNSLMIFAGRDPYLKTNLNDTWILIKTSNEEIDEEFISKIPYSSSIIEYKDLVNRIKLKNIITDKYEEKSNNKYLWLKVNFLFNNNENIILERRKPSITRYKNNLFIIGGLGEKHFYNDVHILNLTFYNDFLKENRHITQFSPENEYSCYNNKADFFVCCGIRNKIKTYFEYLKDHDEGTDTLKSVIKEFLKSNINKTSAFMIKKLFGHDSYQENIEKINGLNDKNAHIENIVDEYNLVIINRNTCFIISKFNFFKRISWDDISNSFLKQYYNNKIDKEFIDLTKYSFENEMVKLLLVFLSQGTFSINITVYQLYKFCLLLQKLRLIKIVKYLLTTLIKKIKEINSKNKIIIRNFDTNSELNSNNSDKSNGIEENNGYNEAKILISNLKEYCEYKSNQIIDKELFFIGIEKEIAIQLNNHYSDNANIIVNQNDNNNNNGLIKKKTCILERNYLGSTSFIIIIKLIDYNDYFDSNRKASDFYFNYKIDMFNIIKEFKNYESISLLNNINNKRILTKEHLLIILLVLLKISDYLDDEELSISIEKHLLTLLSDIISSINLKTINRFRVNDTINKDIKHNNIINDINEERLILIFSVIQILLSTSKEYINEFIFHRFLLKEFDEESFINKVFNCMSQYYNNKPYKEYQINCNEDDIDKNDNKLLSIIFKNLIGNSVYEIVDCNVINNKEAAVQIFLNIVNSFILFLNRNSSFYQCFNKKKINTFQPSFDNDINQPINYNSKVKNNYVSKKSFASNLAFNNYKEEDSNFKGKYSNITSNKEDFISVLMSDKYVVNKHVMHNNALSKKSKSLFFIKKINNHRSDDSESYRKTNLDEDCKDINKDYWNYKYKYYDTDEVNQPDNIMLSKRRSNIAIHKQIRTDNYDNYKNSGFHHNEECHLVKNIYNNLYCNSFNNCYDKILRSNINDIQDRHNLNTDIYTSNLNLNTNNDIQWLDNKDNYIKNEYLSICDNSRNKELLDSSLINQELELVEKLEIINNQIKNLNLNL